MQVTNDKTQGKPTRPWLIKEVIILVWSLFKAFIQAFFRTVFWIVPRPYKDIRSDVVLITGGGKGLGRLIAFELAKYQPKQIVLWGRHADPLEATARAVRMKGVPCAAMVCDVSNRQQVYAKSAEVCTRFGRVMMLINNAGVVFGNTVLESDPEEMAYTFNTNTLGQLWLVKAFLPGMMASNRGHIVSVNSVLGLMGLGGAADYCASKHALTGFYECLEMEMKAEGSSRVQVTCIHPYMVNTDMFAGASVRFPWLFPFLDREYVARRVVDAILTNQSRVVIPRFMDLALLARSLFPTDAWWAINKFTGVDTSMDGFHGRSKAIVEKQN